MTTGIYMIKSPTGKIYIGQSRVIENRWRRHKEAKRNSRLYCSLRKHGWRNHEFKILHELPIDVPQDVLNKYEEIYLENFSVGHIMLNVRKAGSIGEFSQEHKENLSISHIGQTPWNKGTKGLQDAWNKGLKYGMNKYRFMLNGVIIEIDNLILYCEQNMIQYTTMIHLSRGTGYYGKKNYYKGYSRV